jgi:hypothetical protein
MYAVKLMKTIAAGNYGMEDEHASLEDQRRNGYKEDVEK